MLQLNERMFPEIPHFRGRHAAMLLVLFGVIVLGGIIVPPIRDQLGQQASLLANIFGPEKQDPLVISQQELANLTQPGIVRIYDHVAGKINIPYFDINLKTLDIILSTTTPKKRAVSSSTSAALGNALALFQGGGPVTIDNYLQGSGFVVNTNGYILTNAHVADPKSLEDQLLAGAAAFKFLEKTLTLTPAQLNELKAELGKLGINDLDQSKAANLFQKKIDTELLPFVSSTVAADLRVINPALTGVNASTSFDEAYHASVIAYHKNYLEDKNDVALIKINAANLPALELGDAATLVQGASVYAFGFPASADALSGPVAESTFTPGSVTAIKQVTGANFQAIETNAKISPGSSGSPLLDKDGKVVGIITFESGVSSGDSFAFAIPISLAKNLMDQAGIKNDIGSFGMHVQAGLAYAHANHCAQAAAQFKAAESPDIFGIGHAISQSAADCIALISAGNSIDSMWDALRIAAKHAGMVVWGIIGGAIVFIAGTIFVIIRIRKKVRSEAATLETEKQEIATLQAQERKLEERFSHSPSQSSLSPSDTPATQPVAPPSDPLEDYIRTAKSAGQSDEAILETLKTAGWPEDKVLVALTKIVTGKI